ncbi:hypothetical protein VZ94_00980 [Methylocucumis oryzae]|uniref:DNA (cytosine-5-)-methyltransferase n=1 Tax=Methylocucumis oryzae TaxID=1632867 RepID=A0A0F3IQY4_9GAMM|nr:hypothetical protein VZ94_00980 [Methylocucumis oryzae]
MKKMAGLRNLSQPKNGWGTEGCAVGDNGMLEWAVLDAQWFGVPQRRKRVFAVVDFGNWASRPPILLERRSLRGNFKSSVEKTPSITKRVSTDFEKLYAVQGHIIRHNPKNGGDGLGIRDDVYPTLTTHIKHAVAFRACGQDGFTPSYISPPILASDGGGAGVPAVMHNSVVRYLTVTECARLMGFSDDYLTVEFNGKQPSKRQQYMALGNSMAVPVMKYVGERIKEII